MNILISYLIVIVAAIFTVGGLVSQAQAVLGQSAQFAGGRALCCKALALLLLVVGLYSGRGHLFATIITFFLSSGMLLVAVAVARKWKLR